ncbi:MAG TPA: hypothetical protein VD907_06270 [Verrucomicrobiae bacterium]|nr:hypothetical protein [Verrucomicrobiae bacterium]
MERSNDEFSLSRQQVSALNAVDLRLYGVVHGIQAKKRVDQISEGDYQKLKEVVDALDARRGDVLAIEPTGFVSLDEPPSIPSIIPVSAEATQALPPDELQPQLLELLEEGRSERVINNLAYVAARALLHRVEVHTAEVTESEWEAIQAKAEASSTDAASKKEQEQVARNSKMLARLGDIAIDMTTGNRSGDRSVLLYATGAAHTPRLSGRLAAAGVKFRSTVLKS